MEIRIANRSAVSDTEVRAFDANGRDVVLCEIDGRIVAMDGICTHEDLPLDGGAVEDGIIECPWHGALYEGLTGRVKGLPATRPLQTFPVRIDDGGDILVEIPE